jgi:hypothetical protein
MVFFAGGLFLAVVAQWASGTRTLAIGPRTNAITDTLPQGLVRFGVARMKGKNRSRPLVDVDQNMTYQGGPVQHFQTVFTIFWSPSGYSFPSGYQTTINQFMQDLNATSYYRIASQYNDTTGYISGSLIYGGT